MTKSLNKELQRKVFTEQMFINIGAVKVKFTYIPVQTGASHELASTDVSQ